MSKTATIATKVTEETLNALDLMAKRRGTSVYDLVLSAIVMLLRMGSKKQALSQRVMESWHVFEHLYGSLSIANLATLKQQDLEIQDAIYRVTQKGKQEAMLMYMGRPFFGDARVNQNNEDIVAMVLRTAYPSTYRVLEDIRMDNNLPTIMAVISHLINEYHSGCLTEEIESLFSDNARADNNRDLRDKQPYVRKHNKTIYSQAQLNFDTDEQGQELQQTDQPHGMEATQFEDEEGI